MLVACSVICGIVVFNYMYIVRYIDTGSSLNKTWVVTESRNGEYSHSTNYGSSNVWVLTDISASRYLRKLNQE